MKTCARCRKQKAESEFGKNRHTGDALHCYCRACCKEKRRAVPRDVRKAYEKKYRDKLTPEQKLAKSRRDYANNPEASRRKSRKHWNGLPLEVRRARRRKQVLAAYGLTQADYDAVLSAQAGGCAICETTDPNHWSGQFHIDHCHESGMVRGLLCHNCNSAIGHLRDDADLLRAAIRYIENSRKPRLRLV